ncbi:MAG: TraM recognition domain-containing protein [Micropepsaceae bacterium]
MLILGGIGSGKTSASGRLLALAYLMHGFGLLWLCAKPDEADNVRELAFLAERESDLRIIDAEGTYRFNFLEAERQAKGDNPMQLASVLVETADQLAAATAGGRGSSAEGEAFWRAELTKLAENTIQTAIMGGRKVEMATLANIVRTAPASLEEYNSDSWTGECASCLQDAAVQAVKDPEAERDFDNLVAYWSGDWARLDERTRGPIRSSFTTMSRIFDRRPLRRLLSSDTNLSPQDIFDGRIVVVALDPATHGIDGRICNFVWKQAFQRAVLARRVTQQTRPVCLWADEAQTFIDAKDPDYQGRCRSARGCTVFMSQSPAALKRMIPGDKGDDAVIDFLGNLQTKILHQTSSPEAARFFSDLFSKELVSEMNANIHNGPDGGTSSGSSMTRTERDKLPAIRFTQLRTGGAENGYIVEAYIRKSTTPRFLQTGESFLKVAFPQYHFAPDGYFDEEG